MIALVLRLNGKKKKRKKNEKKKKKLITNVTKSFGLTNPYGYRSICMFQGKKGERDKEDEKQKNTK